MKPLSSALIFPETEPSVHDIGKLLLFFNSLSYYFPVESKNSDKNNQVLFKNLCTGYAPAPLGEDLDRFNALLREMGNSRPDDLARLFSFAKAPIATGQIRDRDESSSSSVLSALHENSEHKEAALFKERLWQARLILKLAETLDSREKEVRIGLERITSDEKKIFASLEGLHEPEPARFRADASESGSALLIPTRIKAWAELFLADFSANRPTTLVTACPDSADILLDGYEYIWQKTSQKLLSISIPVYSDTEDYLSVRNKLRAAAGESLEFFNGEIAAGHANFKQEHINAWEQTIKTEFPSPSQEYQKLDFYHLPETSPALLFRKIFNLEPVKTSKESPLTTSILAVLSA
jgi:hypothetical protein